MTLKPLIPPSGSAGEKVGQVSADLLETHESTKTSASLSENLNALPAAGASAVGASTGGDLGAGNLAREPVREATSDTQKAATDAVAGVRNQLAEITTELCRAGETVQRFGADFDRFWEDWSGRFLRNEAKPSSNPSLEPPPPIATHWDREPGELVARASSPAGSGGVSPRESVAIAEPRSETLRELAAGTAAVREQRRNAPAPVHGGESVAAAGAGPVGAGGKPPFASSAGELDERPSPRVAAAGFEQTAAADRQPSATDKTTSLVDMLNHDGNLEAAQAHLLIRLEQTLAGHQRTLDQAVKLIEAQSGHASFTLTLLGNTGRQIAAVHARLEQLEAQHGNSRNNQISG
jgi:hypothetical protein